MAPKSAAEAALKYKDDYIGMDGFLFPEEPPLAWHQIVKYEKYPTFRFRWDEENRGSGKSYWHARFGIVDGLLRPNRTFIYSGPSYRQSKHPFHYIRDLIYRGGPWLASELAKDPVENTERSEIVLKNGTKFVALPASGELIHGERGTDLILTEFFAYDVDLYRRTVKPMLAVRGRRGPWLNTLTIESTAGYQYHFSYDEREKWRRMVAAGHPDYYFISVDVDDLKAIDFPMDWAIVESDRETDEDVYQQQYLNVWLSLAGNFYEHAVLSREDLKAAGILRSARPGKTYVAGGDVARVKGADDSALTVWEVDRSLSVPPAIVHLAVWNGQTAERLAGEWARLIDRFNITTLMMDFQGGGRGVMDVLRTDRHRILEVDDPEPILGRRIVQAFSSTPTNINEMHHGFRGAAESGRIAFPAEPERSDGQLKHIYDLMDVVIKQMCDLKTKTLPSGWLNFSAPSGKKKDLAYSTLYGYWAVRQMLKVHEAPSRDRGSPIVESDLSRTLIGENPFGIQA